MPRLASFPIISQEPTIVIPTIEEDSSNTPNSISGITHPDYDSMIMEWEKWRATYESGDRFIEKYLEKFSRRERADDFQTRKKITPIPAFAKAAINDVKNAIFQRMVDIIRSNGPKSYMDSVAGEANGVDLRSGTMNWFMGHHILPELLVMKKVGVYVDMPQLQGPTLADSANKHPYFYRYRAEDIRSWLRDSENRNFTLLLLRDNQIIQDPATGLPNQKRTIFRLYWVDPEGGVNLQLYDENSKTLGDRIHLNIPEIPFVCFELTESLIKDVCNHQIALLNLESSDIGFILKSNYPFYVEQRDGSMNWRTPPKAQPIVGTDGLNLGCEVVCDETNSNTIEVGATQGRTYGKDLDPPSFIHPSPEPLQVSMEKQSNLKDDIRILVDIALSNTKSASAESKQMDQQGLESGLSYIGLELENGERKLAQLWSLYMGSPDIATIKYPTQYSLKSDDDRIKEANARILVLPQVSSITLRKSILKQIANLLLGDRVKPEVLAKVYLEIENSPLTVSDPVQLTQDIADGVISRGLVAKVKGYPKGDVKIAVKENARRLAMIQKSQASPNAIKNPAARGLPELDPNQQSGKTEKTGKRKRGKGK